MQSFIAYLSNNERVAVPIGVFVFFLIVLAAFAYRRGGRKALAEEVFGDISNIFFYVALVHVVVTFVAHADLQLPDTWVFSKGAFICGALIVGIYIAISLAKGVISSIWSRYGASMRGWVYRNQNPVRFYTIIIIWSILLIAYLFLIGMRS
jgi:hypothetical protein